MSGGQQQRVALARALATEPKLLLMDEPLSALDAQVRLYLRAEIRRLQKQLGLTTIMVTHDQEEALTMADRIIVMSKGRLMQNASPQEVYRTPSDPFVAGFIGSMNFLARWTVENPGQLRNGNVVLHTSEPMGQTAREVTVAIRPEDIRIMADQPSEQNIIQTQVEQIEFRGSSYRLRLRMQSDTPGGDAQCLEMDLQSELLERFGIEEQCALPVHLPPDRLLFFYNPNSEEGHSGAH
jgi:iron(III) transport system ATP-binding protein